MLVTVTVEFSSSVSLSPAPLLARVGVSLVLASTCKLKDPAKSLALLVRGDELHTGDAASILGGLRVLLLQLPGALRLVRLLKQCHHINEACIPTQILTSGTSHNPQSPMG